MSVRPSTKRTSLLVGVVAVSSFLVSLLTVPAITPLSGPLGPRFTTLVGIKLFFSTFTIVLVAILLVVYVQIYRKMPNPFTLSLLVLTVLLGCYALTSNPLVPLLFGFDVIEAGPFTFLPELFTSVAVIVLLHQSLK